MDVANYMRVLWRFRLLAAAGMVLALLLATLSVARVAWDNSPKLTYRQSETWTSTSTLFVTQSGFPLGRSFYNRVAPLPNGESVSVYQDPSRFSSYAVLYANLAMSDQVKQAMLRSGPLDGIVLASVPSQPSNTAIALPIVQVSGVATTGNAAKQTARRATRALIAYVTNQQTASRIPESQRVLLRVLNKPQPAVLAKARSKTRPVATFLAIAFMVVGLIFVLENLRPQVRGRSPEAVADDELADASAFAPPNRRTA